MEDHLIRVLERCGLHLLDEPGGLVLTDGKMRLQADFSGMLKRIEFGKLSKELLIRASKVRVEGRAPLVVDATAGLGEDSFLLAAAGFEVLMFEDNPVIATLLEDALSRASKEARLAGIAKRMHFEQRDSIAALGQMMAAPDVIYLDPMFPERRKSASVKKKFQLLHKLEGKAPNELSLLDAAISASPRKVVIKRPVKGEYLGAIKPSYSLNGKAVRFDVHVGV